MQQQNITTVAQPMHFIPLSGTTFFCAAFTLIIRVIMGIYFYKAVQNFGQGLKSKSKRLFYIKLTITVIHMQLAVYAALVVNLGTD